MAKREVPTVNETLMDKMTLHDLRLQHVSNGTARRARKLLFAAHEDVMEQLQGRLERAARKGFDTGPVTTKRLQDLSAAFRRQTKALMPETRALIAGEAVEGAADEVAYLNKLVTDTVPIDVSFLAPSAATIRNAALMTPFEGKVLSEWTQKLGRDTLSRFNQQVRIGLVTGEDYRQIARRIRGTRNRGFRDGVLGWQRYEAETLARTATAHARAVVRNETFQENSHLLKGVRWSATLDTRTCLRCAALDGRTWDIGQAHPEVPLHFSCRCSLLGIVKSFRELGFDIDDLPPGTRAALGGEVPSTMNYPQWIKQQPASVQLESLGRGRYERMKGGEGVGDFVNRQNRILTLKELRAKEGR